MGDLVAGVLVAVEEADSVGWVLVGVHHARTQIGFVLDLLRSKIDQQRAFPRHHVNVGTNEKEQRCRER